MNIKKTAFVLLNTSVFLFVVFHLFFYVQKVSGIVGALKVGTSSSSNTSGFFDFVGPTPGTGGSLPTGTPQYYVVVGYNGSPTPTPIVKSAPTVCAVGSGQNSCTLNWPCIAGAATYRAYYATSVSGVADGNSPKYLSASAPSTSVTHTSDNGTSGTTIPTGDLPFANLFPYGGQYANILACKIGIGTIPGTPTPAAAVQVGGNIRLNGSSTMGNGIAPTSTLDYVTKAYADWTCYKKKNPYALYIPFSEGSGTTAAGTGTAARNGTLTNSPTWVAGFSGNAVDTGSGSNTKYVAISSLPLGSVWTIMAWTKFPLANTGSYRTLTRGTNDHQILVDSNGILGSYDNAGGTGWKSTTYDTDGIAAGWHLVAAVGSGSTTTFYIDGSLVGSVAWKSSDDIVAIGNYQGGTQSWGTFDQFVVYRSALTQTAIQNIWTQQAP